MNLKDKRFKDVVSVIEATYFEQITLWGLNNTKLNWKEDYSGLLIEVGLLNNMGTSICITFATILDRLICFYEPTSLVVDYRLINNWIKDNFKNISKHDAMNFNNCILHVKDLNAKEIKND